VVFWAKTLLDEGRAPGAKARALAPQGRTAAGLDLPGAGGPAGAGADGAPEEAPDPDLDQYNAYLDRLNRQAQAGRGRRPR
jgi:hypothetical protein